MRYLLSLGPTRILLLLPIVGFVIIGPLLWYFPVYPDETQWKLVNSRLLLDGGKLIYLFPACVKGILLDPPITWYPSRLLDAALFADATDTQRLRYWSLAVLLSMVLYVVFVVRRTIAPTAPFDSALGMVLAPLSIGVLPFVLVMNRPEQGILLPLLVGCTLPILVSKRPNAAVAWTVGAIYVLLAWTITASHPKGTFFLPALVLAGILFVRQWVPGMVIVGGAALGAAETYRFWGMRTDCPELPFLTQIVKLLMLSPGDLANGVLPFVKRMMDNLQALPAYWRNVSFQAEYQSGWLPSAASPLNAFERAINATIPVLLALGVLIAIAAVFAELITAFRRRAWPRPAALIAGLLLMGIFAVLSLQVTKNFYEAGLLGPVLGFAVLLVLPGLQEILPAARKAASAIMVGLVLFAAINHAALTARFSGNVLQWRQEIMVRPTEQAKVRELAARCDLAVGPQSRRVIMDDFTYSALWQIRQPILIPYFHGWWATGLNQNKAVRDLKDSGDLVGLSHLSPAIQGFGDRARRLLLRENQRRAMTLVAGGTHKPSQAAAMGFCLESAPVLS